MGSLHGFFITGTDTGVGKTYVTTWLVQNWRHLGLNGVGLKPLATGDRDDGLRLLEASGGVLSLDQVNPLYLREPAAPVVAARAEGRELTGREVSQTVHRQLEALSLMDVSHVALEGVGGWRVPLANGYEIRDLAVELSWPVVVVALNRLGVINHTLLTVESILATGLQCAGVVLNEGPADDPECCKRNLAITTSAGLLRDGLGSGLTPVFELNRTTHAAGEIPLWLR